MTVLARFATFLVLIVTTSGACAGEVSPFAEALVWHASEETSSVWSSVITPNVLVPASTSTFSAAGVRFDWSTGLRTGVAFAPEDSPWDAKLAWTYLPTSRGIDIPPGDQTIVPESFSGFLSGDAFSFIGATVDWKLNYNTVDLETGFKIDVGRSWFVRPSLGLKIAAINQSIHSTWTNPLINLNATGDVRHDYLGIGPNFGLGFGWDVPRAAGLRLLGSVSCAFMSGVWNVRDTYERSSPLNSANTYRTFTTEMNDSQLGTLMVRYFFGLEWTLPRRNAITVHLGYELQWWANQQRLPTFQQLPMHGDLSLQGGSCGLSYSF